MTKDGAAERAELGRRSDDLAADILAPLDEGQRGRLVAAMGEVERLLVASMVRVEAVGCGALKFHGGWAELKRMWIAPSVRGLGLGRRLLAELEAAAVARGVRTLRLETNRTLTEAIALYRSAGYREVAAFNKEPYAHHWFEKGL